MSPNKERKGSSNSTPVEREHNTVSSGSRYLVTGAGGFMGGHMVDLLVARGHEVVATDLMESPPPDLPQGVEYIPADLTEPESLEAPCRGIDIIFNPASIFDYSTPWEVMKRVNVDGVENLCRAAHRAGVSRMVHWSTMIMFGDGSVRTEPFHEDTPRVTNCLYGRSKVLQEDIVLKYSREGKLPATVIRPSIVYGPRSNYGLADMVFKLRRLPIIPVFTQLKKRTCMVHVRDVVEAAYYLSRRDDAVDECYHVTDDTALLIRDMFTIMAGILGKVPVPVFLPFSWLKWMAAMLAELSSRYRWMRIAGRPVMEKDFVNTLDMDGYATNAKLKSTGYEFHYPDWRSGLVEVAGWYCERGLW